MPPTIPLQPGKYYHIYNRGNNREDLFREERNYRYFLELYAHHIHPIADTYAYCLMRNHFHSLIHTREKLLQDPSGLSYEPTSSTPTPALTTRTTAAPARSSSAHSAASKSPPTPTSPT